MSRSFGSGSLAAALMAGVYWAMYALRTQDISPFPEPITWLWEGVVPIVIGVSVAFGVGFYVGRWWVILLGVAPLVPLAILESRGFRSPYHEAAEPLSGWIWWVAAIAVPAEVGVLMRRALARRPGVARN